MGKYATGRFLHIVILLTMLAAALLVRMQDYDWSAALRFLAFDSYNKIAPREHNADVVIVDIDEASFSRGELGQWPWSRDVMGRMVQNLHDMGARAIVFDIVFPEYDRTSPKALMLRQNEDIKTQLQDIIAAMPDHDRVFADAIKQSGNVVTAFIWSSQQEATRRTPILSQRILVTKDAASLVETVPHMTGVVTNIPEIAQASAGNGSFGVSPEIDGIIRRVPLLFSFAQDTKTGTDLDAVLYPSLALETLRVAQGAKEMIRVRALKAEEAGAFDAPLMVNIGAYNVPMDWDGLFFVHFAKARTDRYIPAWEVIDGSVDDSRIKDKIIFIGTSAEGLKDIRSTPLDLYIPGVELHVNIVEQIMAGDYLLRPQVIEGGELLAVAVIGLGIIILSPFVGALLMAFVTLGLSSGIFMASWLAYSHYGLLIDPVYPSLCIAVLFVMSALLSYMRTEAERKQVRDAFGHYISPEVMAELTKNPDKLKLGGETRDLTVMFTDIRNFTSISETMPPEALIQLMNDFLTPMSDLVMAHRGTIDKYMGDAMMAFWNAPLDDILHARHACLAALKMNKALIPINDRIAQNAKEKNMAPAFLEAGIGINTGKASVGNMGSRQRFAYSALGDAVNLASRLEGQTKYYGVRILIGEDTCRNVPELATLELDLIRVKGKHEPERIFVLLGDEHMAATDYYKDWKKDHDRMLALYRNRDWDKAMAMAAKCQAVSGDGMTGFYNMFMQRIKDMVKTPPAADWDGVFIASSK